MENLSRIAKGIFLGNGEIWNFLDYAVNRDCGGLMVYTRKNNFLGNNLINNFKLDEGKPRYSYSDIDNTGIYYGIDRVNNRVTNSGLNGIGDNIGVFYKVPKEVNGGLKFITNTEFIKLNEHIMSQNIMRLKHSSYEEKAPKAYMSEIDKTNDVKTHLIERRIGDKYIKEETYKKISHDYTLESIGKIGREFASKQNIFIKEKIGSNRGTQTNEYKLRDYSTNHTLRKNSSPTEYIENGKYEKYKDVIEVADIIMDKQQTGIKHLYIYTGGPEFNNFGDRRLVPTTEEVYNSILKAKSSDPIKWIDIKYEYTTKFPYKESRTSGIYEIYEPERLFSIKNIKNKWSREISYGVEINERGEEYYSINEKNKFKGDVSISSEFNGEGHSVYDVNGGVRSYTLYEEGGVEGLTTADHTSDGMSVASSSYENGSRLLKKTNELFQQSKINSLINRFHIKADKDELTTAYDNTYGLSRGRNLLKVDENGNVIIDKSSGYDDPYCRVWTARHQYSKLKDRIRPFVDKDGKELTIEDVQSNYGYLRTSEGSYNLTEYSVLRSDGFVRITPTHKEGGRFETPQNYMFSIENLAWRDITSDSNNKALSPEQRGPNGGRIMWFPPYNLKFSENVNVNWNANTFIGRGEEIYTYTNTVRTGTLDFTLLIDHPSILNKWRGTSSEIDNKEEKERDLLRFFAGCGNINDVVEPTNPVKEEEGVKTEELPKVNPKPVFHTKKIAYVIFFPNNFSGYDFLGKGGNIDDAISELRKYNANMSSERKDSDFKNQNVAEYNKVSEGLKPKDSDFEIRQTLFAGASDIDEIHYFDDLEQIGKQISGDKIFGHSSTNCKILNIEVKGFASSHGWLMTNMTLCDRRRFFIKSMITKKAPYLMKHSNPFKVWKNSDGSVINVPDIANKQYVNTKDAKLARAAYAIVNIQWKEENNTGEGSLTNDISKTLNGVTLDGFTNREKGEITKTIANKTNLHVVKAILDEEYTYDNEYLYFSEVMGDQLIHKHIVDKVRFFDPAFHSITPEGFNARLTFLHQCTRQGPTNAVSSGRVKADGSDDYLKFAGNLAFGRAPYCILRVGDFFHTKICIDSMSITYDNNGVQWDLNPEGAGVQPMYANVSLSFKFLGGQDLVKPIERLQNAVTANYYANASVYSRHADTNKYYYDAFEDKIENKDGREK